MSMHEALYQNYLKKLEALKSENAKSDWTDEGNTAYYIAFMEAKQAYQLLCNVPAEAATV